MLYTGTISQLKTVMMKMRNLGLSALALLTAWFYFVYIPKAVQTVVPLPLDGTPADVGLRFEEFSLSPADTDLQLAGWWMPAENPRANLVFIHGAGSNRYSRFFSSLDFYAAMVERGISVSVVDLRNHGLSGSDGEGLGMGTTEKWDALALIDWTRARSPELPLFAMGISMGGATLIHAGAHGADINGLILLDPLLDTHSAIVQGVWIQSGLPAGLFMPSAWAATTFYNLPGGEQQAANLAADLDIPMLLLQDPEDPVTLAVHARALAAANPAIRYRELPAADDAQQTLLSWRGRWGSHVAAFFLFPEQVVAEITAFMGLSN